MLRIAVPQLKDARQNGTHCGEIQRLLAFVETLQIVPEVLAGLIGKTANDFLRVSEPTNAGWRSWAGRSASYIRTYMVVKGLLGDEAVGSREVCGSWKGSDGFVTAVEKCGKVGRGSE